MKQNLDWIDYVPKNLTLKEVHDKYVYSVFKSVKWNQKEAAKVLGLTHVGAHHKYKKLNSEGWELKK